MTHNANPWRRLLPAALMTIAILSATDARAQPPDVLALVGGMKQALEPVRPSLRKMTLTVAQGGTTSTVTLGQARGIVGGANLILTVVLAPGDLRGTAYLVQEQAASASDRLWTYVPAIGRVRTVVGPEAFSAFLNSDFTYSDLGFTALRWTYTVKDGDAVNGAKTYRVEGVPQQQWYYARVVSLIAADGFMPIQRDFFDPANQPWKVERFETVKTVNGVPTPLLVSMDDTQSKSRTTLTITDLAYDAQVPEALLKPEGMPKAVESPVWGALKAPVGK
jgi:outer membrane lipoprotein-sorting protein